MTEQLCVRCKETGKLWQFRKKILKIHTVNINEIMLISVAGLLQRTSPPTTSRESDGRAGGKNRSKGTDTGLPSSGKLSTEFVVHSRNLKHTRQPVQSAGGGGTGTEPTGVTMGQVDFGFHAEQWGSPRG